MSAVDLRGVEARLYVKRRQDGLVSFYYCLGSGPHKKLWTTSSVSPLSQATRIQISGFLTLLLAEVENLLQSSFGPVDPSSLTLSSDTSLSTSSPSVTLPSDMPPTTES